MEYFAGLDVSMEETHVCVIDRDGKVILEARTPTAPKTIATALAKGPAVERVLFETGRMAPTLFHGLTALGFAGGLRREPTSVPGVEIAGRPQDRPQ
jgi:transposase